MTGDLRWMDFANCKGMGSERFFMERRDKGYEKTKRENRKLCSECPVREPCLLFALRNNEDGFWGGTTEEERKAIKVSAYQRQREALIGGTQ